MSTKIMPVNEYLNIKLERNNNYIRFLENHNIMLQKEIILNYRIHEANKKKIALFREVNALEQKQIERFIPQIEIYAQDIYTKINYTEPEQFETLSNEINKLKKKCIELRNKVNIINTMMPRTLDISFT
jgi:hypothetical protein